jgi:hypothetical protein
MNVIFGTHPPTTPTPAPLLGTSMNNTRTASIIHDWIRMVFDASILEREEYSIVLPTYLNRLMLNGYIVIS